LLEFFNVVSLLAIAVVVLGSLLAVITTFYQPLFQYLWPRLWFKILWWFGLVLAIALIAGKLGIGPRRGG
jgi:hypothetical protein